MQINTPDAGQAPPGKPAAFAKAKHRDRIDATAIYYGLFFLNLLSLLMLAWVNSLLHRNYIELAEANVVWSLANQRTATLTKAAREANAPPNDVFNSLRVDTEETRLHLSLSDLFKIMALEKIELEKLPVPSQRNRLLGNLAQSHKQLEHMAAAAQLVFVNFKTKNKQKADSSMALTDRKYGEFLDTMSQRDSIIDTLQSDLFLQGEQYRNGLSNLVSLGIGLVSLLVCGVFFYGVRLAHRTQAATAALHLTGNALEQSEVRLRQLNDQLERLLSAQQRFIADAAHQLRTPIAGMSLQIELALKSKSIEEALPALAQLRTASKRVVRLSGQLLTLASADAKIGEGAPFEQIDLVALVREVGLRWIPQALEKNIDMELESAVHPVLLRGNAVLLQELVSNLIDNAVRYSPAYGRIMIAIKAEPMPQLTIEDTGPGIAQSEFDNIFKPFYRAPGNKSDGAGLGLAIVSDIAKLHHGKITAENPTSGNGLRLRVTFGTPDPLETT